jgi:hypothetical protein
MSLEATSPEVGHLRSLIVIEVALLLENTMVLPSRPFLTSQLSMYRRLGVTEPDAFDDILRLPIGMYVNRLENLLCVRGFSMEGRPPEMERDKVDLA